MPPGRARRPGGAASITGLSGNHHRSPARQRQRHPGSGQRRRRRASRRSAAPTAPSWRRHQPAAGWRPSRPA